MALPENRLRPLVCEERNFGWLTRSTPSYCHASLLSEITIALQELDIEKPQVLYVTLNIRHPNNWISGDQSLIKPSLIRKIIIAAMEDGWEPDGGGSAYAFSYELGESS